jgi:acyl-CoA reductase-like NAD-dependent aldehyde dehydrogenase
MAEMPSAEDWKREATRLQVRHQAFIDGKYVDAASGRTFDSVNPATGEVLSKIAACDKEDIDRAVAAARRALVAGKWSRMAPAGRKRRLQKLAELMMKHAGELALLETLNMGKPIRDSSSIDVPAAANCIAWNGEAIDKLYDQVAPTDANVVATITRDRSASSAPWCRGTSRS